MTRWIAYQFKEMGIENKQNLMEHLKILAMYGTEFVKNHKEKKELYNTLMKAAKIIETEK